MKGIVTGINKYGTTTAQSAVNANKMWWKRIQSAQFSRKQNENEHLSQISDKSNEKVAHEKTYWLKLEFCYTDRKMKNIIRRIFSSIIMHPNFMHFH